MLPNAVVLVGLPGSGKSHLAAQLHANGWEVCSQDTEGGDRIACERRAWECLSRGKRIVLDRTNNTIEQRALWVSLIKASVCTQTTELVQIAAVVVDTPLDECLERVKTRKDHPTLLEENAEEAIRRCAEDFQLPTKDEGFSFVLNLSPASTQGATIRTMDVAAGKSDEKDTFLRHLQDAVSAEQREDEQHSQPPTTSEEEEDEDDADGHRNNSCTPGEAPQDAGGELGSVVAKMECVYTTGFLSCDPSSACAASAAEKGENIATPHLRPSARAMFESGQYVATVKVHGRCCKWEGGQCFRRLDVQLASPALASRKKLRKGELGMCNAFITAASAQLGTDLRRCWQAGHPRDWSWGEAIQRNWGWIVTAVERGWKPTAPPDRQGHWIGYTPVYHASAEGHVLPVEHDADVRHGFDEERRVAFCLQWGGEEGEDGGGGARGMERLELVEVPVGEMLDGSYELVGPNDAHGGPYRRSLPNPVYDASYNAARKFPAWAADRNQRHYFVRHGAVQWVPADHGGRPPPSPVDQVGLREWLRGAGVEGVVWHGTGPLAGSLFKCHRGHLGLTPLKSFSFSRPLHSFLPAAAPTGTGRPASPTPAPDVQVASAPSKSDSELAAAFVRVRLCLRGDLRDSRVVVATRSLAALQTAAKNKWRQSKRAGRVTLSVLDSRAGNLNGQGALRELSAEEARDLPNGTLLVVQ